jgi:hypothetical protein
MRFTDDTGGNGDGYIQPGETPQVFPILQNEGLGAASNVVMHVVTDDPYISLLSNELDFGIVSGNSTREPLLPLEVVVSPDATAPHIARIDFSVLADDNIAFGGQFGLFIGEGILYEDFEGDVASGWTTYGTSGLWHVQSRDAISGSQAFYCGEEGALEYPPFADAYLRSPSFEFEGEGALIIATRYDMPDAGDAGRIDLQTGPSTYHLLSTLTGTAATWQALTLSLSGLPASMDARVRFWLSADASVEGEGWYLDNVLIVSEPVAVTNGSSALPDQFELEQNFPNPFNSETLFRYAVPTRAQVRVALYDIQGRHIGDLVDRMSEPGLYDVRWQPIALASGLYFARLESGSTAITRKLVYLK